MITSLTLGVDPAPEQRVYEGWTAARLRRWGSATWCAAGPGWPAPTVLRLSDEAETRAGLGPRRCAPGGRAGSGCLAIVGWEGTHEEVERRRRGSAERASGGPGDRGGGRGRGLGLRALPRPVPARRAARRRRAGGNARDGDVLVGAAGRLYAAVGAALRDTLTPGHPARGPVPHLTHIPAGSVAVLHGRVRPTGGPDRPVAAAKAAAGEAILAAGGSISHHHGVGAEHREALPREVGALGVGRAAGGQAHAGSGRDPQSWRMIAARPR